MRESTGLGGELEAPGIVLVALPQLGQPAAIGRLIPLASWCAPWLQASGVGVAGCGAGMLAGVTARGCCLVVLGVGDPSGQGAAGESVCGGCDGGDRQAVGAAPGCRGP